MTDSDGTLLQNHTPETGGAWVKRAGANNAEIQSNKAKAISTGARLYTNDATPGAAEYDVIADVNTGSGGSQLLARFQDTNNYYTFRHDGTQWLLQKKVGGVTTTLDSLTEGVPAGEKQWKLEIRDATKKGYLDGVEKVTSADNALTSAGEVGLGTITNDTHDNFQADDVAASGENAKMTPGNVRWQR